MFFFTDRMRYKPEAEVGRGAIGRPLGHGGSK